jgi:site-specific recombinase XerD
MHENDNLPVPNPIPQPVPFSATVNHQDWLPAIIEDAGPKASRHFVEFFAVPISNPHTRTAYLHATRLFLDWCARQGLQLEQVAPIHLAMYRELLNRGDLDGKRRSLPTVKQHFSALRMLFGWLVEKGVLPANPAREVKTEKFHRGEGKTPALSVDEMHQLLQSFDTDSVVGLRDRALIAVMAYTFARVEAAVDLRVKDYFQNGRRSFVRLREKGGKEKEIPAHHMLEQALDDYIAAAGLGFDKLSHRAQDPEGPLFRTAIRRTKQLTDRPMRRTDAWAMVRRRCRDAGLVGAYSCHSFRATGITTFLENQGSLETAQYLAGHADSRTTKLYDRRQQRLTREDVERIRYGEE